MDSLELIRRLCRQMEWADATVWKTVLGAPAPEDKVLRDRLHHIHLVQQSFLHIWKAAPFEPHAAGGMAMPALCEWARGYHAALASFVASLSAADLDGAVRLPWAEHVIERFGKNALTPALADTLLQVTAHSSYHRGQVNSRLRELGVEPPLTDYIAWIWLGTPGPAWPEPAGK